MSYNLSYELLSSFVFHYWMDAIILARIYHANYVGDFLCQNKKQ